jgi:hypothetical protein
MSTTRKIAIGLGIAGGALLAAWLLTGDRKKKTKEFIAKKTQDLKGTLNSLKNDKAEIRDDDIHYV